MRHWVMLFALAWVIVPMQAEPVQQRSEDGLRLNGNYYAPPIAPAPAVLLLHELYTTSASWQPFAESLQAAGYAVLAPDLRGWGRTHGSIDWRAAQTDTQYWLAWLREQPDVLPTRVFIIGSSMGANLAVIGCADDNLTNPDGGCVGAVAVSPGLNYYGYTPLPPALEALVNRPVLLMSAERDSYPARAVRGLPAEAPGTVEAWWFPGNAHGMRLFDAPLQERTIAWLGAH